MVICGDGQDDVEMILAASGHINGDFWFYFFIFCFLFSPDYYLVELPGLQQGRGVALSHRRSRRRGVRYVGTNTCHRPTPRGFFPSQPNAFAQSEDGDDQAKPQTPSPFTSRPISQLTKELSLSVPRIEVAPLPVFGQFKTSRRFQYTSGRRPDTGGCLTLRECSQPSPCPACQ
ncbi:hypothetical protein IWX91DRAFT_30710 [Phyllosticta citricarpa]